MPFTSFRKPDFRKLQRKVQDAEQEWLDLLAKFVVDEHLKLVSNWKNQPKFATTFSEKPSEFAVEVSTSNENWLRVNFGTGLRGPKKQSYIISPKDPSGTLAFQPKYRPKTTRGKHGGPGTRSGKTVLTRDVLAKGIRPRRFDLRVKKEARKVFFPKWVNVLRVAITN